MAAIVVSLIASSLASTTSSSSSSLVFRKLRSTPLLGLSFAVTPLCCRRRKRMAHSLARATLGLTQPVQIDPPKISFSAKEIDVVEWKGDILAVGVTEKDMVKDENLKFQNPILKKLDSHLSGLLAEASLEEDFNGKAGESTVLRLSGMGQKGLGESVAAAAKASQASNVAIVIASPEGLSAESKLHTASAIVSGTLLGTFEDNRFKSESKKSLLTSVDILGLGTGSDLLKKLKYTEDVCSGIILGKELVNAPANVLTPGLYSLFNLIIFLVLLSTLYNVHLCIPIITVVYDDSYILRGFAEEASKIASMYGDVISATILDVEQCKELKMGSYLGVAAASENPPHFIHLCYKPPSGPVKTKLALVGKGLTFDRADTISYVCSGGYNIKTGPGCLIELMKFDMGGSAAVLGAAKALGQIKPAGVEVNYFLLGLHIVMCPYLSFSDLSLLIEVHFIVAACENMISGTGMRPGDIVTASNGKTIEVIVDLATLTGACIVALGPSIAGVFTPSDDLAKEVMAASEASGEKLWRMPLEESYWESMKSGVADMVNTGGRQGGAITAALFLKQFVDEKVQWMHIDMAGPSGMIKRKLRPDLAFQLW
ncbi:hypothetical protein C3L33_05509, partial [Rhododendron williamsianum]